MTKAETKEFYKKTYTGFLDEKKQDQASLLFPKYEKTLITKEERTELIFNELKIQERSYADKNYYEAFVRLCDRAEKLGLYKSKKYYPIIEEEFQKIMKSFLDSYSGKTKKLYSKVEIGEQLQTMFQKYAKHFASSSKISRHLLSFGRNYV